jgi:hypothetical protein
MEHAGKEVKNGLDFLGNRKVLPGRARLNQIFNRFGAFPRAVFT